MNADADTLPGWAAASLVAGTSASVLVLEILAGRLLAPYVGVSLETYTGIIGTILAGISVGAWAGGVMADRVDARRLIPLLLMLGGVLAMSTIPLVRLVGSASGSGGGPRILVLAAVGFLPAATVLSAVPPAVIKLQLRDLGATGSTVGRLSAWSTGGAIVGTFFTGFVLVAAASVTSLIVGVGVVLVVAGLGAWLAGRHIGGRASGRDVLGIAGIAGIGAMALLGVGVVDSPCDVQTSYYCLSVRTDTDRAGGRVLVLDDLTHSYVDLDDPLHLEYWYVRRLVDAIELVAAGDGGLSRIVFLGGGGLTIPRYVRAAHPEVAQTVYEIDDELIRVDRTELGYEPSRSITIEIGDARLELADRADRSADVVIGDAFGSRSVPFHLATVEFIADVERVLRPDGVYAANVIDSAGQRFLAAEARTIRRVFDHVVVVRGPAAAEGGRGNSVIIASNEPIDVGALDRRRAAVGDDGAVVDDLTAFVAGAPLLTDDFAPVDQLIASGD